MFALRGWCWFLNKHCWAAVRAGGGEYSLSRSVRGPGPWCKARRSSQRGSAAARPVSPLGAAPPWLPAKRPLCRLLQPPSSCLPLVLVYSQTTAGPLSASEEASSATAAAAGSCARRTPAGSATGSLATLRAMTSATLAATGYWGYRRCCQCVLHISATGCWGYRRCCQRVLWGRLVCAPVTNC